MAESLTEVWQRGPIADIPALAQPVAHALLQAEAEIIELMHHFPDSKLYLRPDGLASVAFHLKHLTGVLDRLFTYAQDQPLTVVQLQYLAGENLEHGDAVTILVSKFSQQVQQSLAYLRNLDAASLTEQRFAGRKRIPTTLNGLLVHAAEHSMRHVGQLRVTSRWVLLMPVK